MKPFTYHTHSTYCDGKNAPEELAKAALLCGADSLGIAYHSYVDFDAAYCIKPSKIPELENEVRRLQKLYAHQGLDIFFGVEQDAIPPLPENLQNHDYVIGSMHYLEFEGEYLIVDGRKNYFNALAHQFHNDAVALSLEYYKNIGALYERTKCNIVGHFDLVTKYNESGCIFDESNPGYEAAAGSAAEKLARQGLIFEINTGAIARGYRSEPYPSKRLLSVIREAGGKVTFGSDCHDEAYITHGFDLAQRIARECGFRHFMKLKRTPSGCEFVPEEIEVIK